MNERNEAKVLRAISEDDVVLDIGGWARPFNRANFVLDAQPYETRGYYGPARPPQGGVLEYFNHSTWIQRDICDRTAYPFADKELDFVICSQTLEDVRDPLWVCAEMNRIAKRGYIEVPTRDNESSRGAEYGIVGLSHHRWLIDIDDDELVFTMKYHMIHAEPRFSLPAAYRRRHVVPEPDQWLFWEGAFGYREVTIHGLSAIATELDRYVAQRYRYPFWSRGCQRIVAGTRRFAQRVCGWLRRTLLSSS